LKLVQWLIRSGGILGNEFVADGRDVRWH